MISTETKVPTVIPLNACHDKLLWGFPSIHAMTSYSGDMTKHILLELKVFLQFLDKLNCMIKLKTFLKN